MTVYPTCQFPLLSNSEAIARAKTAISDREPFSLIRVNDGEAVVLSFGEDLSLQDLAYLHGHWGARGVTLGAVAEVKRDLETAVQGADVVGIRDDIINVSLPEDLLDRPGPEIKEVVISAFRLREGEIDNLSVIGARRLTLLYQALRKIDWPEEQQYCSVWIHWELLATGTLNEILEDVPEVGLVTSKPEIEYMVARRFDLPTSAVIVPDKFADTGRSGRHVPERYRDIRSELAFPPGTLVLVGAGIPGKVYCQWLKEAGCVAIDVGAVFDAWLGRASRPRVLESRFKVAAGNSVPRNLQLRVPPLDEDRRLIPKWKPEGLLK